MMGEFNQEFRDGFIEACLHLVNRDFDALAKDFVTLGYFFYSFLPIANELILIFVVIYKFELRLLADFFRQLQIRRGLQKL